MMASSLGLFQFVDSKRKTDFFHVQMLIEEKSSNSNLKRLYLVLTLLDIRYFLVDSTWGGALRSQPTGKNPFGPFMSTKDLVTHLAHRNGQYYLKQSKIKNCPKISIFSK